MVQSRQPFLLLSTHMLLLCWTAYCDVSFSRVSSPSLFRFLCRRQHCQTCYVEYFNETTEKYRHKKCFIDSEQLALVDRRKKEDGEEEGNPKSAEVSVQATTWIRLSLAFEFISLNVSITTIIALSTNACFYRVLLLFPIINYRFINQHRYYFFQPIFANIWFFLYFKN